MSKDQFFIWCTVKRHLSKGSLLNTRIRYDYLFRWLGKRQLTAGSAEAFILYLRERDLRHASLNSYIRVLKLINDFERQNGNDFNLLRNIDYFPKQKKVPTILSIEEIEAIIFAEIPFYACRKGMNAQKNSFYNRTIRLAVWLLAATGCRYEEMASLKVENVQYGIPTFVIFKDTKTDEDREVPIPPTLAEELRTHTAERKPNELVFVTTKGNHLPEQSFNPFLRRKVEIAGIKNKHVHAHVFRYSFIMEYIRRKTGHLTISKLVGHRDPKTTLGYTKYERQEIIEGAENHPLFARTLTPEKLLEKDAEVFQRLPTNGDSRFKTELTKAADFVLCKISISQSQFSS